MPPFPLIPPPIEIRPRGWIVAITVSLALWALIWLALACGSAML